MLTEKDTGLESFDNYKYNVHTTDLMRVVVRSRAKAMFVNILSLLLSTNVFDKKKKKFINEICMQTEALFCVTCV